MRVAAIDIGTNSMRLLVAEVEKSDHGIELKTIARAGEPCRLGKGLDRSGLIDSAIAARAAQIAHEFVARSHSLGAVHVVVGATAALRKATNGVDVAEAIRARIGIPVRILSGEQEARTVYSSVVGGLGVSAGNSSCVVFDIGGGSTEIVSGVGSVPGRWTSLPMGAVNLTERYLTSGPPTEGELAALREAVAAEIMHDCAFMPATVPLLAGVGGTITVLALLDRGLLSYDPVLIQGWMIDRERLTDLIRRISTSSQAERRSWPALGEGRADIVVAGAIVVEAVAKRFPASSLVCSTQGLRYGLARWAAEEILRPVQGDEVPR